MKNGPRQRIRRAAIVIRRRNQPDQDRGCHCLNHTVRKAAVEAWVSLALVRGAGWAGRNA
jgi:hypothetical protein